MDWLPPSLAVATATLTMACSPTLLRRIPEPQLDPGEYKDPYGSLVRPRFIATVGLAALVSALIVVQTTPFYYWPVWLPLAGLGALLAGVDACQMYLPLRLTQLLAVLMGIGAIVAAWLTTNPWLLVAVASGFVGLGAMFWLLWRWNHSLGFGDVRLAGLIGAAAALHRVEAVVWSALVGSLIGLGWGFVVRVRQGPGTAFPYGPGLWAGPFVALALSSWWLSTG